MKRKKDKNSDSSYRQLLDSWLSDDPPTPEVESRLRAPYIPPPDDHPIFDSSSTEKLPPAEPGTTNITINVHVPKVKVPQLKKLDLNRLKKMPHTTAGSLSILAVGMMLAGLATHSFIFRPSAQPATAQPNQVLGATGANNQLSATSMGTSDQPSASQPQLSTNAVSSGVSDSTKASFTPVAPASKPELGNYAFAKTSYDSSQGTYTYIDVLGGKVFSVTERQIPGSYSSPQQAVDKIAGSIGAKEPIASPSGLGYILTDTKSGQQTIVFSMDKLLISINSNFTHAAHEWADYIATLRSP